MSSDAVMNCSVCKMSFDQDHGVWVCLTCTQKLTNAIHQSSMSPPPFKQNKSGEITIFLSLINNGHNRRFKYRAHDSHKNLSLSDIKQYLLKRFKTDLKIDKLISNATLLSEWTKFEINDDKYKNEYILFEDLEDLYDGCKITINVDRHYYSKYEIKSGHGAIKNKSNSILISSKSMKSLNKSKPDRKRTRSAEMKLNDLSYYTNDKPSISYDVSNDSENEINNINNGQPIIMDNGSGSIKCGFGGIASSKGGSTKLTNDPQIVLPTFYYNPLLASNSNHKLFKHIEIGHKAIDIADQLGLYQSDKNLSNFMKPIKRGLITNWNQMEFIWNDIFNKQLSTLCRNKNYNISNHPLLMSERFKTPNKNREKLLEVMFETFNVPSLYLTHSPCLSVYGTGRTKGVVLDIGADCTQIVAIHDKTTLSQNNGSQIINFGGSDITNKIITKYNKYNFGYKSSNKLKERFFIVPAEPVDIYFLSKHDITYKLPDGSQIKLPGKDRIIKYDPTYSNYSNYEHDFGNMNISELIKNCIEKNSNNNIQNVLWNNIVLSGGTTCIKGFAERFSKEIKKLAPKTTVVASGSRKYLSYIGGSVLSSISTFKKISISRAMYNENGPRILKQMKM